MPHRRTTTELPTWLWFFIALPIGLITAMLWKRRQLAALAHRTPELWQKPAEILGRPRYVEPDSIPIDMRLPIEEDSPVVHEEIAVDQSSLEAQAQEPDNLEMIEGIGPRIASLLMEQGITSFRALADTPTERLIEILDEANLRRITDPSTWAEQAQLAANGDMEGLQKLKDSLKGGRRKSNKD